MLYNSYFNKKRLEKETQYNDPGLFIPYIDNRIKEQDGKIADLIIRLDVIETMLARRNSYVKPMVYQNFPSENMEKNLSQSDVISKKHNLSRQSERMILEVLVNREMTALDVMELLKCTREHAARMMKNLYVKGFVTRDDSKRPFVYRITENGKKFLS